MKQFLLAVILSISICASGQNVSLILDSIRVADATYYEGQEIMLGKGTDPKKEFSFIKTGKHIDSLISLPAAYANQPLKIEMIYRNDYGAMIVASPFNSSGKPEYILIRAEEAFISRELLRPAAVKKELMGRTVAILE